VDLPLEIAREEVVSREVAVAPKEVLAGGERMRDHQIPLGPTRKLTEPTCYEHHLIDRSVDGVQRLLDTLVVVGLFDERSEQVLRQTVTTVNLNSVLHPLEVV